jgi:hypothetical protein
VRVFLIPTHRMIESCIHVRRCESLGPVLPLSLVADFARWLHYSSTCRCGARPESGTRVLDVWLNDSDSGRSNQPYNDRHQRNFNTLCGFPKTPVRKLDYLLSHHLRAVRITAAELVRSEAQ